MFRRLFAAAMIAFPMLPANAEIESEINVSYSTGNCFGNLPKAYRLLELRTYHAAPGKLDALLDRFRNHTVNLFQKHQIRNIGYWVPVDNKDNLLIYVVAYPDEEARETAWKAFAEDPEWKKVVSESEKDGKLVVKVDHLFLKPTDFSEGFTILEKNKEHLFEMRTYTTVPDRLPNLHARFKDHTLALFSKHGITNLAYFQPTTKEVGSEDTLLYFIAHKDMDSAVKSWESFRADPDWIAAKKASEENAGGSLTKEGGVKSLFLKPTDFSPVK